MPNSEEVAISIKEEGEKGKGVQLVEAKTSGTRGNQDAKTQPPKNQKMNNSEENKEKGTESYLDKDLLVKLFEQKAETSGTRGDQKELTKIQKVTEVIKHGNEKYYTPKAISIGPIHAMKKQLMKKDLKHRLAAKFIINSKPKSEHITNSDNTSEVTTDSNNMPQLTADSNKTLSELTADSNKTSELITDSNKTSELITDSNNTPQLEFLVSKIRENIVNIKACYNNSVLVPFEDDQLVNLFLLDGCSVLQFIHSFVRNEVKEFRISNGLAGLIQQDLFLLENQLPFQLLNLLMDSSDQRSELSESINKLVVMNCISPPDNFLFYNFKRHMLSLFSLMKGGDSLTERHRDSVHLLDLLRFELLFPSDEENKTPPPKELNSSRYNAVQRHSFRNIHELKAAGIKFRPSDTSSLLDVSFSTRCFMTGQLRLPPMIVDSSTALKLWNLVAYEMCPDNYTCNFEISSYLSLLDSLIDNEQDVRDLRSEQVLWNRLSSDEEVAKLFNAIGSNLASYDDNYRDIKNKIQKYYNRKSAAWLAQVCRDHCSTPWTILALFAAAIVLVLTGLSTWFTVYPRKD